MLVHEVGHLVRAHAERADALGAGRDHERWAFWPMPACNDDLVAAGIPLPEGAITPGTLGLAEEGIEEAYYALLADPAVVVIEAGGGPVVAAQGCGSGAGGYSADWELPADDPMATGVRQPMPP